MSDSWDDRRKAQEDGYFEALNKQALARLAQKRTQPARLSPITGSPMEQITIMGVVADRCVASGGIWLDQGELEQILVSAKDSNASLKDFVGIIPALKPGSDIVTEGLKSPVTGEPMHQSKVLDVTVDTCAGSGGIWLDARELDRLIKSSHQSLGSSIVDFFSMVLGKQE